MIGFSAPITSVLCFAGVAMDAILGEPPRAHPLVGFGKLATRLERALNPDRNAAHKSSEAGLGHAISPVPPVPPASPALQARIAGILAWAVAVIPPVVLLVVLTHVLPVVLSCAIQVIALWFALGARSLVDHIGPVEKALNAGDLALARTLTSRVVTRDLSDADEHAVAKAAIESALENGNDAIFGALFWFVVAGGAGALAFRLVNTLDAMWGYRTPRMRYFGWAAARLDDAANYIPARLTALTYALCGNARNALACWRMQASAWESPNAGPVMASGAGSLGVACGGAAWYHGTLEARPELGSGRAPRAADIGRALSLVKRSVALWLAAIALLAAASTFL
ncbi:CobD/CbiB family cobalamin biosynthesis protein [Trinickia dinghuensis]|uniref:Cobalamin biosynthesis protein CobD n=1 Tax=Trinickia dinghuensis TaxID=2291023 RepID=A0A3D8JWB8_9BURK|nr:CobD/CbiB family cobalamin biosynthesis protein [Trinickia dinghuensis]RDU96906.1 cobalamin biosynthesis protein [Trinickia dinghuensis]